MKCTNCGKNEANYHYRYNINGKVTEAHLCPDCAAKAEGKPEGFDFDFDEAFRSFDRMMDNVWGGFFGGRGLMPFGGFGFGMPALAAGPATLERPAEKAEKTAEKKPEADAELSRRREINALKSELSEAVKAENFERAIELRDKLRELEK